MALRFLNRRDLALLVGAMLVLTLGGTIASANDSAPIISKIHKQTTRQATTAAAVSFTVTDDLTPADNLILSASSSDPAIVPNENIVFGGGGTNRSVIVRPVPDQTGKAIITVTVNDGVNSASARFKLKVKRPKRNLANTPPFILPIADQTIEANTSTGPLTIAISDTETSSGKLYLSVTCSDPILVPSANLVLEGSGPDRTLTITPAPNKAGPATITIATSDGKTTSLSSFQLMVNSVTAPPKVELYIAFEAESGTIASPMSVTAEKQASNGACLSSPVPGQGSVSFSVNIPVSDTYVIWCRILGASSDSNSFEVSLDGGPEDTYDAGEGRWSTDWQWTAVNGRAGVAPLTLEPRMFSLPAGTHTITFRSRDPNAILDRLIITNDREIAFR